MSKKKIYLLIAFIAAIIVTLVSTYFFLIKSLPGSYGPRRISILDSEVKVIKDNWGIPHIYAKNSKDLYRVLGYLLARDRLFQMDIYRRTANGQLAEVLGPKAVKLDIRSKVLDLAGHAKENLATHKAEYSQEFWDSSNAFYEGINYYIDSGELSYEFSLLGYKPAHFQIEDGLAFTGVMGLGFSVGLKQDLLLSKITQRDQAVGRLLRGILPEIDDTKLPVVSITDQALQSLLSLVSESPVNFIGSNSWVISGKKSKSGFPLLANDPHMSFSMPGIWYEAHLHTPEFEMYGHFLPIIPFAILGHNRHHGWGITMSMADDVDFYKEKIDYDRHKVMHKGEWQPLVYKDYIIKIRGGAKRILRVPQTAHGPVVNSMLGDDQQQDISIKWSYHNKKNLTMKGLFKLNRANNLAEFTDGLKLGVSPGLNISYADREGNIGWWIFGELAIRPPKCDSRVVNRGDDGSCDYLGIIPFEQHPHLVNPPEGYIVSANSTPPVEVANVRGDWRPNDRYNTIKELLLRQDLHDYKSMMAIQSANKNLTNLVLLNIMVKAVEQDMPKSKLKKTTLLILKEWDGEANLKSIGISIYSIWLRFLSQEIFDELTPQEYKVFADLSLSYDILKELLDDFSNPLWKVVEDEKGITPRQVIHKSFDRTIAYMNKRLGPITEYWTWDNLHQIEFVHPLGRIPGLSKIFNYGPFPIEGGKRHVNALSTHFSNLSFKVKSGVSTRRVIDFANAAASFGVLPLGQSAHILSKHYSDQWPLFSKGKYRSQLMDKILIEQSKESVIIFLPSKK